MLPILTKFSRTYFYTEFTKRLCQCRFYSGGRAMKFAKVVFWIAGIWGFLVILPLYFMFDLIGRKDPPRPSLTPASITASSDSRSPGKLLSLHHRHRSNSLSSH